MQGHCVKKRHKDSGESNHISEKNFGSHESVGLDVEVTFGGLPCFVDFG